MCTFFYAPSLRGDTHRFTCAVDDCSQVWVWSATMIIPRGLAMHQKLRACSHDDLERICDALKLRACSAACSLDNLKFDSRRIGNCTHVHHNRKCFMWNGAHSAKKAKQKKQWIRRRAHLAAMISNRFAKHRKLNRKTIFDKWTDIAITIPNGLVVHQRFDAFSHGDLKWICGAPDTARAHTHTHIHTHTRTHARTHTYIHTHTYTHTHAHTYTHTKTHTHIHRHTTMHTHIHT